MRLMNQPKHPITADPLAQPIGRTPTVAPLLEAERAAERIHDEATRRLTRLRGLVDPHFGAGTRTGGDDVLEVLQAKADLPEAERNLVLAEIALRQARVAREAGWQVEVKARLAARAEARKALVSALLEKAEDFARHVTGLRQHDEITGRLTGSYFDPLFADFPARLVFVRDKLARQGQAITPPAPPTGSTRIKVVEKCRDHERLYRLPADVVDLPARVAREVIEKGWGVGV